jgi:hypothetical protein
MGQWRRHCTVSIAPSGLDYSHELVTDYERLTYAERAFAGWMQKLIQPWIISLQSLARSNH